MSEKNIHPLLSIVIPVKINTGTLEFTLKTVLSQNYPNIQIVVSNNSQQSSVIQLIKEMDDPRIKCITPDILCANFSADWEFALSGVDGEYVTFLGDDDGVLPGAYALGMNYLDKFDVDAFTWKKIDYNWPDHLLPHLSSMFIGDTKSEITKIKARKALALLAKFQIGYNVLPCIYNSIVSMTDIKSVIAKSKDNKFFSGSIPDVYSGIAIASQIKSYFYASFPLTINGASGKSSGVIQGEVEHTKEQIIQIKDVLDSKSRYHKDIGEFSSSITSIVMGEYLIAQDKISGFFGPTPSWHWYVRHLVREAGNSKQSEKILAAALYTIKKRRLFMPFVNKENKRQQQVESSMFFHGSMKVPADKIANVEDASIFLKGLVPQMENVREVTLKKIFIDWLSESLKSMIAFYRVTKL